MNSDLIEQLVKLNEQQRGDEFILKVALDSDAAKRMGVRVDDPKKYPVGTTVYFMSDVQDEDGFWWVDFVTDKNLLNRNSYGSRDPGVIRFTPSRFNSIYQVVEPKKQVEEARSPVYTMELIQKISQLTDLKRLDSWAVADGTVALFRYEKDGNAYEVEVRPISAGKRKELWGDKIKKKEDREIHPDSEDFT